MCIRAVYSIYIYCAYVAFTHYFRSMTRLRFCFKPFVRKLTIGLSFLPHFCSEFKLVMKKNAANAQRKLPTFDVRDKSSLSDV